MGVGGGDEALGGSCIGVRGRAAESGVVHGRSLGEGGLTMQ